MFVTSNWILLLFPPIAEMAVGKYIGFKAKELPLTILKYNTLEEIS